MSRKLEEKTRVEVAKDKQGHFEVLIDNETTRITFHHIEKGQSSGWHDHDLDYVGYHFGDSDVQIERGDGLVDRRLHRRVRRARGLDAREEVVDERAARLKRLRICDSAVPRVAATDVHTQASLTRPIVVEGLIES